MKGYELYEDEAIRTKYTEEELNKFDNWCLNDCALIIDNPFKNDTVWKRDRHSECIHLLSIIDMFWLTSICNLNMNSFLL